MAQIQKARFLKWIVTTLEQTTYKTTQELIQTLVSRPGGMAFNAITAEINKYANVFLSNQQNRERDNVGPYNPSLRYDEDITLKPEFKQSLINMIIYLVEKTNFDEFLKDSEQNRYDNDVLACDF